MGLAFAQLILVLMSMSSLLFSPEDELAEVVWFVALIVGVCLLPVLQHIGTTRKYFAADNPHAIDILPELKKRRRRARIFNGFYSAVLGIVILFMTFILLVDLTSSKGLLDIGPKAVVFAVLYIGLALAYRWYIGTLSEQIARLDSQKQKQISETIKREDIQALPKDEMAQFSKMRFRYIGYLVLMIAGVWAGFSLLIGMPIPPTNGTFLCIAGLAYVFALPRATRAYQEHVKKAFLPTLLEKHNLAYSDKPVFEMQELFPHGIVQPYLEQKVDDAFTGTINGREIAVQEFALGVVVDADPDKEKARLNAFAGRGQRGIAIRIPLNKKLDCHTLVFSRSRLNMIGLRFPKYKPVGLLNTKLNKHYEVYANDQMEARYIFDPAFMERFAELIHQLPIADIEASFKDRELAILCLQDKDSFQTGSLFTRLKPESFEPVVREIETFTSIIDLLELDPERGL